MLEYRVWCHPHDGAPDIDDGGDYYYVFETYEEAFQYFKGNAGTEEPTALELQKEYIEENELGKVVHIKEQRLTEWLVEFLSRSKRNATTIPAFFSPTAPSNRVDILRGVV